MTRTVMLGVVIGAQGIRGEVRVKTFTAEPEAIGDYGPLQDASGQRRFKLTVRRVSKGDVVIASIEGVTDRNAAEALKGTELHVERTALPQAEPGEYYHADLIGLQAITVTGRVLGQVVAVHNFGAGDMLEVRTEGGRSAMVPFTDDAVPEVDIAGGKLLVEPAFWLGDESKGDGRKEDGRKVEG
ncbi:ribosome maturation factor RimM [uncultured Ferrovibrio sp.]|jgi:16S rRNA processing protein RimM|uniref:ribosome maturation factor RimM n=1 Tax=uncultured Ferrovibrio sp. TaxID=1576913 RepID=UPI002633C195|nr:ribosome maturation factor RimM [uncultured Ferrovibrio sp.]